jgi:hypothetical protein
MVSYIYKILYFLYKILYFFTFFILDISKDGDELHSQILYS